MAANAQTAKSPTNHGKEKDNRLINLGTRFLSLTLSIILFKIKTCPPIP